MSDSETLSEEEYKRWLPIPQAIARCEPMWNDLTAGRAIWDRMESGLLRSAAASVVRPQMPTRKFLLILPGWWGLQAALVNLDFWKTGDITLRRSSGSYGIPDSTFASLFGVRVDPAGLEEFVPQRLPSETAAPAPSGPTLAEFQRWLIPADALDRLPEDWGRGHGVDAIKTHLRVGGIMAVAQRGLIATDEGQQPVELYPIPPELWDEGLWTMGSGALWVTGQASFHRGSRLAEILGHPPDEWVEHTFTGIRFDPDDFAREFTGTLPTSSQPGPSESESDRRDKPPLPDALLRQWHELFILAYPNGRVELARQSVAGMFPRHHVSRERVRDLFPERSPGRPRKNKDNP